MLLNLFCAANFTGDSIAQLERAQRLESAGDYRAAIDAYRRAIDYDPEYTPLYINLGNCFYQIGEFAEAEKAYVQVLDIDPTNPWAIANLNALEFDGPKKQQRPVVTNFFNTPTHFETQIVRAVRAAQVDIGLIFSVIEKESHFKIDAASSAGAAGLMQLMPGTARELGLAVPSENNKTLQITNPDKDERLNPVKNIRAGSQYLASLIERYRSGNSLDLRRPLAAYNMGPAVVSKSGTIPQPGLNYANSVIETYSYYRYNSQPQIERIQDMQKQFSNKSSENEELDHAISDDLQDPANERFDAMIETLCDLESTFEDSADLARLYTNIGAIKLFQGRYDDATNYYATAFDLEPLKPERSAHLGHVHLLQQHYSESMKNLKVALRLDSTNGPALVDYAEAQVMSGHLDSAAVLLQRALDIDSLNVQALNDYGLVHAGKGRFQEAIDFFDRAVAEDSSYFLALYNKAALELLFSQMQFGYDTDFAFDQSYAMCDSIQFAVPAKIDESEERLAWPVHIPPSITSFWGWRPNPFNHSFSDMKFHDGIDLDGSIGDDILACADGVVESSGYRAGGYGNSIVIRQKVGNEIYHTEYHHLSLCQVAAGDSVKKGQVIGKMGNSGTSTGSHLHFTVYEKNRNHTIDPLSVLEPVEPFAWRMR